ncbi:MAG: site-2 protease family protein [Candidatus Loosdrechtia sp.]|uniref:site-2 protease family protein n=1 Tax=Candidatus Loosdrechtia sp. TaxID=3101272 RepID=UPI003A735D4B|nr:MAG: site-2 protease family protein [Candidatus Jettenia sp. AMX2]
MFGRRITLFKLFGFEVKIDISWLILAVLVTFTLAQGFFPYYYRGLSLAAYWWMGIFGALGLFASIIFHEFWHSIIARKYGLPMKGITLFIFGGVAEMDDEPPNAKTEFLMSIAGPLSSVFLGFLFFGIKLLIPADGILVPIRAVISYLSYINLILAAFNMLPAFPLDGGRVLRSVLWKLKNNIRWATNIASWTGSAFGVTLMVLGILSIFHGNFIGGIWFFIIGMFLRSTAQMSYQQVLLRNILHGKKVRHFTKSNPVSVPPSLSIEQFVEDYFYKYHYKMFPVVENGDLIGCIDINQVKNVPRNEWGLQLIKEHIGICRPDNTIDPSADALKALSRMRQTGNNRLIVIENGKLVGIITLKDILNYFSARMDLDEYDIG